jgi:hypothetical protein
MGKFYVYTSRPSKGARALAKALGGKRIQTNFNQTVVNGLMIGAPGLVLNDDDTIINWGDSQCTHLFPLNKSSAIRLVANKLTAFDAFSSANVPIPAYAKAKADVGWEGLTVVRHKLTGHSGEGIELCDAAELPDAPLYVKYIPKEQEYRIHVGTSRVAGTEPVSVSSRSSGRLVVTKSRTVKSTGRSATTPTASSSPVKTSRTEQNVSGCCPCRSHASGLISEPSTSF